MVIYSPYKETQGKTPHHSYNSFVPKSLFNVLHISFVSVKCIVVRSLKRMKVQRLSLLNEENRFCINMVQMETYGDCPKDTRLKFVKRERLKDWCLKNSD